MAQAAQTLYGRCTKGVSAVQKAWDAVGVPGVCSPVRPPSHF